MGRSIAVVERGNARVQIFDDHGWCLYVIKAFHWSRDLQIGEELIVDASGTVEELGLPTGGESLYQTACCLPCCLAGKVAVACFLLTVFLAMYRFS